MGTRSALLYSLSSGTRPMRCNIRKRETISRKPLKRAGVGTRRARV